MNALTNSTTEKWAAIGALAGAAAVLLKRLFNRKPKPEYITRAEFHHQLDATRDRIGASYLAVATKLDQHHDQVLQRLDTFEARLDQLDTAVARLDERTAH